MIITDTALTIEYSNADAEYMGRFYLLKAFQQLYSDDDSDPEAANFVARKNDFSDLADDDDGSVGAELSKRRDAGGDQGGHFCKDPAEFSPT